MAEQIVCRCGKVCYDKRGAQRARNKQRELGRARDLELYQCKGFCWHLSHQRFNGFNENGRRFRK